jgi:hypothetical protein
LEAVGILLAAVVAIAGLVMYNQLVREHTAERTLQMQGAAARLGWQFTASVSFDSIPAVRQFELFARGHHRQIRNFMSGKSGEHPVAIFDYEYVTGGGRSRRRWVQTVVNVHTPGMDYVRFELKPEEVFHRIGSLLGYQDIDLERHPGFSRAYLLRGPDEAAIRRAFTPHVVDFFERHTYHQAEAGGPDLFFWYSGEANVPTLLNDALALAARLQTGTPPLADGSPSVPNAG